MSAESKPGTSKAEATNEEAVEDILAGMPKTKQEKGLYILCAQAFVETNAHKTKKNFIAFVNWFRTNRNQFVLNEEEKDALMKLHAMWKTVKIKDSNLFFYVDMKDHHTKLNGRFYTGAYGGPECAIWKNYIHEFQHWRCVSMHHHYVIAKFCMADGIYPSSFVGKK